MEYLPLFLRLDAAAVAVVGGGKAALRKAELLARAGARLTVIAPAIEAELAALLEERGGSWLRQEFADGCLRGMRLAVAASSDPALDRRVSEAAQRRGIPVNVVDAPELSTAIFPAIVDRSPLLVAVASGGNSPVLARRVRSQIEALLPAQLGRLAEFAGRFRERVARRLRDAGARRRFWEALLDRPGLQQQICAGGATRAEPILEALLDDFERDAPGGEVYLLGAGPGDPDLVSWKALRLLQAADVVLYDRLVAPRILELARRDAERINVGKQPANHPVAQPDITRMLIELAGQGKRVARLKGGDPFIFGRGGEELEGLAERRIPFQVVPGITAASGCASYAGIPLTHRDHARSVRFVTGHRRDGGLDLPWDSFRDESETLVFYMGLLGAAQICERLRAHGRPGDTPVALVEQGTTPQQRTHVSSLAELPGYLARNEVHAPAIIIVGSVVGLRARLGWYRESRRAARWPPA